MAEPALRLFVAVELPEGVRSALSETIAALRSELRGPYRWVEPGSIHLTLKFLGDVAPGRVGALSAALREAVAPMAPIRLRLEGAGMFPDGRSPRVLWAGVGGETPALDALRDAVEAAMVGAGEAPDPRAFRAHLTLARVRARLAPEEAGSLAERLRAVRYGDATGFCVGDVSLMRSELRQAGAVYTRLAHAALLAPGPDPDASARSG